jgi:glycosyltransferase involved in cell wall biosynthesis
VRSAARRPKSLPQVDDMIASSAARRGSGELTYGTNGIIPPAAERPGGPMIAPPACATLPWHRVSTLQLGMGWFPEQPGGLNRVFHNLLCHLPEIGVAVRGSVVGSDRVGEASANRALAFAPPTASLPYRLWAARRALGQALREESPDLVASHFALFTWPILDLIRPYPLVVHFHGPWSAETTAEGAGELKRRAGRMIERAVYRRATRLIALSRAFAEVLHRSYRIPEERIRVIPGGVDARRFALSRSPQRARAELALPHDRPIIVTVRRLARRMGLEDLLAAIALIRSNVPEVLLVIAGRGPLAAALQARTSELGLQANVRLLGFVSDESLPLLYRAATVSVVPTATLEGFGLVTIESLAAGTPVLVTPVGGLPEVVSDLAPELVLPGTSPPALAEGLLAALSGRLPLPSAKACQDYVRGRFDWPVIAARVRDVYLEALA